MVEREETEERKTEDVEGEEPKGATVGLGYLMASHKLENLPGCRRGDSGLRRAPAPF